MHPTARMYYNEHVRLENLATSAYYAGEMDRYAELIEQANDAYSCYRDFDDDRYRLFLDYT